MNDANKNLQIPRRISEKFFLFYQSFTIENFKKISLGWSLHKIVVVMNERALIIKIILYLLAHAKKHSQF